MIRGLIRYFVLPLLALLLIASSILWVVSHFTNPSVAFPFGWDGSYLRITHIRGGLSFDLLRVYWHASDPPGFATPVWDCTADYDLHGIPSIDGFSRPRFRSPFQWPETGAVGQTRTDGAGKAVAYSHYCLRVASFWLILPIALGVCIVGYPSLFRRRHRRGECENCGYKLIGIRSPTCPECGHRW